MGEKMLRPATPGLLRVLWILDLVLLGLLIAPMAERAPVIIALRLWAVPTLLLAAATWRVRKTA
jgi:hypothetical protein